VQLAETVMLDVVFLVLGLALFAMAGGYVLLIDRM
jgi:hypothetical protein